MINQLMCFGASPYHTRSKKGGLTIHTEVVLRFPSGLGFGDVRMFANLRLPPAKPNLQMVVQVSEGSSSTAPSSLLLRYTLLNPKIRSTS